MVADEPRAAVAGLLLAATSGAADLVCLLTLGGAFAGVITGNMVVIGAGLATGDVARLLAVGVAVAGFALGAAAWSALWRRAPDALVGPLLAELAVLVAAVVTLALTGGRPPEVVLGLAAVALGGQSVVGLRLGKSTTYLTGALTTALHALTTRPIAEARGPALHAAGQLTALVAGAVGAALLTGVGTWAALLLAPVLVGVAAVVVAAARRR
ncbi:YoaK family protein [Pseudonocardia lacus]|uniref:YoaK family protein n=1 Tax=Pseudonocardia lacus TaxID=2835865 RepID=UPI001BDC3E57|nr:YoaK family protein [Pseudonocardia lacus]